MTTTYTGQRWLNGIEVLMDGKEPLPPREDLKKISSNGFEWSYEGVEPAQLALALLADHLQDDDKALRYYDRFMRDVVAYFENDWKMTDTDIDQALSQFETDKR